jgi:phosphopantetheine--protein transferase-like protein
MEEKIREIIAVFTKIPVDQVSPSTMIDRSAVKSSIMLHRMYAKLAEQGVVVEDYWDIKNVGALLQRMNGSLSSKGGMPDTFAVITPGVDETTASDESTAIGIDMELINSMPRVSDFREDAFYTMNFSATEIAYCILQQDAYASFAGLFAAKEAIVKAGNEYMNRPFNTIVIDHLQGGKPVHNEFTLSISHSGEFAIAVAVRVNKPAPQLTGMTENNGMLPARKNLLPFWLILFSLLLSALVFVIVWKR